MSDNRNYGPFYAAAAGLTGAILFTNTGLFLASLCVCRRLGDQARGFVRWLKVSFPFFGGYVNYWNPIFSLRNPITKPPLTIDLSILRFLFFHTLACILGALLWYDVIWNSGAYRVSWNIDSFFYMIAKAAVVLTFSSLIRGILFARNSTPAKLSTPARIAGILFFVLVVILSIVYLGVAIYANVGYYQRTTGRHAWRIEGAINIIIFVISVFLLALSALVLTKVKQFAHLKKVSDFSPPAG